MNGVIGGTSLLLDACANLTVEQKEVLKIVKTSGEVMLTMSVACAVRARTHARMHSRTNGTVRRDGSRAT